MMMMICLDCKTVRILSIQVRASSQTGRHALPISLLILRKNPAVLQSTLCSDFDIDYDKDGAGNR